ncbi:cytochrome p450 [Moniliophthora roreri MCA 2997]|uniref:Cytochrome p450 n=1 Tax=Moniliophthora roreri (strain MCA 2997) TaxID=1381753 RepID=V2WXG7_MONRO|nr:cytochrome p450 [Moniliophthora roreri MCA 2997]
MNSYQILAGLVGAGLIYLLTKYIIFVFMSPLRQLPGPDSESFMHGNFQAILDDDNGQIYRKWEETYGKTFNLNAMFGMKLCGRRIGKRSVIFSRTTLFGRRIVGVGSA